MDEARRSQSTNAQIAIIGSMLIDDACIGDVLSAITADDFPSGTYKSTFQRIKSLFLAGRPIDPITVQEAMQGGDKYAEFLKECMLLTPSAANVLEYCDVLKRTTRLAKLNELGGLLQATASLEQAEEYIAKLNALMVERSGLRITTAAEAAKDFLERMQAKDPPKYLTWGFPSLDRALYVEPGDMILLGGYPSAGKTLLSVAFALHMAREHPVGYYSLETRTRKLVDRAMATMSQVYLEKIKKRAFSKYDWTQLAQAAAEYAKLGIDHVDAAGMTVSDIESTALSRRHKIVFVDYLQLIRARGANRTEEVTNISKGLHLMAQRHGITVVALSQLTRPEKNKKGQTIPPSMASFRESGQIEQDADVALLLWPSDPEDYKSDRKLKIGKNKEGTKDTLTLCFNGATQTMFELSSASAEVYGQQSFESLSDDTELPFDP